MRPRSKRGSLADDCLFAFFTVALTAISVASMERVFPWQAVMAVLMLPTLLLCCHLRYRAAALAAGLACIAGAWIVVPPRWSLRIEPDAVPAFVLFACVAGGLVLACARVSHRKSRPEMITRVPSPHRV